MYTCVRSVAISRRTRDPQPTQLAANLHLTPVPCKVGQRSLGSLGPKIILDTAGGGGGLRLFGCNVVSRVRLFFTKSLPGDDFCNCRTGRIQKRRSCGGLQVTFPRLCGVQSSEGILHQALCVSNHFCNLAFFEVGKPLQVVPQLFSQGCICCSRDLCRCTLDAHSRIREVRLLQLLVASSNVSSFSSSSNGSSSSYSRFKAFRFTADIHCARVLAARAPASGVASIRQGANLRRQCVGSHRTWDCLLNAPIHFVCITDLDLPYSPIVAVRLVVVANNGQSAQAHAPVHPRGPFRCAGAPNLEGGWGRGGGG